MFSQKLMKRIRCRIDWKIQHLQIYCWFIFADVNVQSEKLLLPGDRLE